MSRRPGVQFRRNAQQLSGPSSRTQIIQVGGGVQLAVILHLFIALELYGAAIGEGELDKQGKRKTFAVKEGDRVIFSSYAGTEIKVGGEELMILSENDILGVVEA